MITPTKLEALDLTLSVIAELADVRDAIRRKDRNLADQLTRAATSVALNLSEANGSDPGNKRARLHTALGSARETRTALHIAAAWRYIDVDIATHLDAQLDRICAMTWRLIRRT